MINPRQIGSFYKEFEPELSFSPWMNLKGRIPLYMVIQRGLVT